MYTVLTSKEYSPEELAAFEEEKEKSMGIKTVVKTPVTSNQFMKRGVIWTLAGIVTTLLIMVFKLDHENAQLYIISGLLLAFGLILIISALITRKSNQPKGLVGIMNDLLHMPKTMGQLAVVQFFSWLAFYAKIGRAHV